jgi:hypothetical protein
VGYGFHGTKGEMVKARVLVLATIVAALAFSAQAFAGGSLVATYGGPANTPQVKTQTAAAPVVSPDNASGTLPFTGLDVLPILAGGAILLLAGTALRRSSRKHSSNS